MTTVSNILKHLDSVAPVCNACEWDNCGLLCGDKNANVSKVLLCLDITNDVVEEAKETKCELIISHHPVIFSALKSIEKGSVIYNLIKSGISAICMHTNLDIADNIGVNACLANALKLKNQTLIKDEFMCIGELENKMNCKAFAQYVKDNLKTNGVRFTNVESKVIKRVGVSSGAGSESIEKMQEYALDALVTGEIKHHHFIYAQSNLLCVVEAGHFSTEDVVIKPLTDLLQSQFSDVTFQKSNALCDPVEFV